MASASARRKPPVDRRPAALSLEQWLAVFDPKQPTVRCAGPRKRATGTTDPDVARYINDRLLNSR
jgi:hypothetical protein